MISDDISGLKIVMLGLVDFFTTTIEQWGDKGVELVQRGKCYLSL